MKTAHSKQAMAISGTGIALQALLWNALQAQTAPQNTNVQTPVAGTSIAASTIAANYQIYAGNTHAHTILTSSHGQKAPQNGSPADHHQKAKAAGYDFYITTDHSQEVAFDPTSPTNANWVAVQQQAAAATDATYVGLHGYEHSENDGPGGKGHYNVINSAEYLDALDKGVGVQQFYTWLKTQPGAVVSFNHPGPGGYNKFAYRDEAITDIITLLEVINSNKNIHYPAFLAALDKGWKVSPVCGNDNHGFWGITHHTSRTFVLATAKTKDAILDALKHRRTYAALDKNIQIRYTVNGEIMGSTLNKPGVFHFAIHVEDPDNGDAEDKITRIDIVKDKGEVVQTYTPDNPAHSITWSPTIEDTTSKYFFVRVWNAGSPTPMAWVAPVWSGR